MASELLKRNTLIQRLKEPEVAPINFDLQSTEVEELFTLPESKPEELLDIQEENRKGRLLDSLNIIGGGLMDESVDFIKREEFSDGTKIATKKSLLEFVNPKYLKVAATAPSTQNVLKNIDDTEKFFKEFIKYRDKFFNGNTSAAQKSIFPNADLSSGPQVIQKMRNRLGIKGELSVQQRKKIEGLKEGLTFSEFRTKLVKEPNFLKKVTKGANVNKFYSARELFNLFGITTAKGNPKSNEYFTGELKKAGVTSRPNPIGGGGKQYKLKDVIKFFKENEKTTRLGKTQKEVVEARLGAEQRLDSDLYGFNKKVVRNVRQTAIAEDVYLPTKTLKASAGDHIGHPVSMQITDKPEFKNLLKDSNVNKMNSLVFQDAEINMNALTKQTGYDKKFNTYFKQLNKFLNKPITEKNQAELVKIKNDMDGHYNKIINRINNMSEKNEFFKGQNKRIPKVTIKIPEVGSKFKSSDLFADMSTVDSNYRYGKVQEINPDARFFKDLSYDQKQIFKQNIYNQYSDNLNAFYKAAKIPVQDVEEFSEFIETGGVRETVGQKDIIPIQERGQKKLSALQKLMQTQNVGVDPGLALRAGKEEFLDPLLKGGAKTLRGAGTVADFALSAGKGVTGLGIGLLLEADPIITGMSEGKTFGQTARDTFIGTAIDAIPGVNLGSLNEDLIKLADTEEQKVAVQNLIDYQKDYDRFTKDLNAFKSYARLNQVELEELGFDAGDLVNMEAGLAERFRDIQTRAPKVYNPEAIGLVEGLARKEALRRKENLETGIAGKIFGDFAIKNPNFIDDKTQQILSASTGAEGATDSSEDKYRLLDNTSKMSPQELDDIYEMGGIMGAAEGGRIGFADGPMDPKRRLFLKIMGGIAALPIFSKFLGKSEVAKPIVKIAGSSTKMPDWFPTMINKVMFSGTGKRIDADLTLYEPKELPGIKIYRNDDGRVSVEGTNQYGKRYEIEYEPPGYELIDEKTGKAVKKQGEFIAQEEVPVNVDPDGNTDFDVEVLEDLDEILGPDTASMEKFATGKVTKTVKDFTGDSGMKQGEYNVGAAEARYEQAADEAAETLAEQADEAAGALDEID